jgi:hypothetical protein
VTRAAGLACLVTCAVLAFAPGAWAATPGHYTGTTDQNYPIEFDVADDGQSLTNVVTSYNVFCTVPGPTTAQQRSVNSTFAFPIAGDAISGDDIVVPYLKMAGNFTSPGEASGTFSAFGGGFSGGTPYYCNALERKWSASTTASGPVDPGPVDPGPVNPGPVDPGPVDPGGPAGKPVVTIAFPKGVKLQPSLANGFVVGAGVDQLSTLSGKVILSAKDAKKYGLGKKARTIATAKATNAGPDTLLEFKVSKSIAKKLKSAKKLSLLLDVTAKRADGVTGKASKTLKFS